MTAPLALPSNLTSNLHGIPVVDLRGLLPVNPLYTWEKLAGKRDIKSLTTIVFHHDAWPKSKSARFTDLDLAKEIANDHIKSKKNKPNGDAGFPYDAFVRNGIIYICNDIEPQKYGVSNNNSYTVHICLSGDYVNADTVSEQDRNALYAAFFMYKAIMPSYKQLKGHKELSATSCPGYDMNTVRSDIEALEEQMEYNNTPNANRSLCYAFAERVDDLGRRLTDPKWGPAAEAKIMWLAPAMTQLGITDPLTPDYIVKYWKRVYDNSYKEQFAGEAFRKLLIGANMAKEKGLLP